MPGGGQGPLLLEVGLVPGTKADALLSHHRLERGRAGGGEGQLEGGKKGAVCVHSEERKGADSKHRRKAKPREGCHCEGGTAAPGPEATSQEEPKSLLLCAGRRAKEREEEKPRCRSGGGEERNRRGKRSPEKTRVAGEGLPALAGIEIHPLSL